ncbi:TPA: toprim domain-containing protein [Yersinia enterocolitica]|nr:toprim domain-containing protein [Yersinia enterocolitica]
MNNTVQPEIIRRLIHDFQFKEQKGYLRQGVCPHCKKKELFTSLDKPYVLRCGRENKCGAEIVVKALYADLFDNWSERYPAMSAQPHAAADAYLREARGLDIATLAGAYTQGSYLQKGMGSATVRFTLPNGAHWERLIDRPERFDRKANFNGRFAGEWWSHAGQDLTGQKEIWLVEGIFDALSLNQNGIAAVSLMTCNNYPEKALHALAVSYGSNPRPVLVWALDTGNAGERAIRKHVERSRSEGWTAKAALPPESKLKADWNDLHLAGRLTAKDIETYRYYGALLIARSAIDKALLMFNRTERHEFHFKHDARLYWFKLDIERHMKAVERIQYAEPHLDERAAKAKALKESGAVAEIANCYPTPLYFQKSVATDEAWYYLRIDFPGGIPPVKATFTAAQLSSSSEFKKRLLHVAKGAVYTGNTNQLDKLAKQELPRIKEVNTQNFIGYNREFEAYVFNDVAVHKGTLYPLNDEDYFDMRNLSLKSLSVSPHLALNADLTAFDASWCADLWRAFGVKGYIALAFWLGALFAEQIRTVQKSFPFLELVGEPGSGKSTLLEFLWRLSGRPDYEGFDPSKSTPVARARNFAQVGNLPVCLIEGDRSQDNGKQRAFDWDELKSLYNGRSPRAVGIKTNNNETYEPPFKGAIIIAQNANTEGSKAFLERIIHLHTDRRDQTPQTKAAAEALERYPIESISGFILLAVLKEREILEKFFAGYQVIDTEIEAHPDVQHIRIAKNHAQIIALLEALPLILPLEPGHIRQTREAITQLAAERVQSIQKDHPMVQEFWETFDYLDSREPCGINHSPEPGTIAINFNHFIQVANEHRQPSIDITELKKLLKTGQGRKFSCVKSVRSKVSAAYNSARPAVSTQKLPDVVRCWVFDVQA